MIITHNRTSLLHRALTSVVNQTRPADDVYVVSNSSEVNYEIEKDICRKFSVSLFKNIKTSSHSGALNYSIHLIINNHLVNNDLYFASLDDDDEWHPNYLLEMCNANKSNCDLLVAYLSRINGNLNNIQVLPRALTRNDFLKGNPGVGGSNTFVKVEKLLLVNGFDENLTSNIDRDFFVRLLSNTISQTIVRKHLVNAYTDNGRSRVTNNLDIRIPNFRYFYKKHQHLMDKDIKNEFFLWAEKLFSLSENDIVR
ncbi:MAG: glycosyltransferase family A protein [Candidatus Cloacimonetes bacterium]|nr:glycosyltransferase family A protein [Candidatus Cloacimonadota bacterium]